jgi:hypothetical protein
MEASCDCQPEHCRAQAFSKSMSMRRLQQILTGETAVAELLTRRQHELALEARVKQALPPSLAAQVTVADGRPPELALLATSGAAAALLRHRAPDLLRALMQEGKEFTGIRVRVQARPPARPAPKPAIKQIDESSAVALEVAAAGLGDSPLAAAMVRLAARARESASEIGEDAPHRVIDKYRKQ